MTTDLLRPTYAVRTIKNVMIPMSDGTRLAADLLVPDGPGPFPAILEYLPYRKDDMPALPGSPHHYLAERGFVGARVDVRGTGGSEGVATDEYTPQEQLDACEVIAWLSRQAWCNGNVGMWGSSYGGFTAIQTAMHNPPALKAIVAHAATDDRYNDDVHYYGGCLQAIELLPYPLGMVAANALPPHAEYAKEDWARIWQQHMEQNPPWMLNWLRHQTEDEYWLRGSLKADYGAIRCPVYLIGGWADGYTNAVFRMLKHLRVPNKALVGPWVHMRPADAYPGPNIHYLHELARWWAYWLRGEKTGVMEEPPIALYIQEGAAPHPFLPHMPGHWRGLDTWPPEGVHDQVLYLGARGCLCSQPERCTESDLYPYRATVGTASGFWCPAGALGLSQDQAVDEARSLTYTSAPLDAPLEILGAPRATLYVSSTAEIAYFAVKISDVAPDGSSRLVCRGLLNATHRSSHCEPEPLAPGEVYELHISLKYTSWIFQAGHRLRVAIASSDWPTVWPSPLPATNHVFRGRARPSHIVLPVVDPDASWAPQPQFLPPPASSERTPAFTQADKPSWQVIRDVAEGTMVVRIQGGRSLAEVGASDEHPEQAYAKGISRRTILHRDGKTEAVARAGIKSTATELHVDIELNIKVDDEPFYGRHWLETIPRNLM